jgi:hypothetical protein
VSRSTDVPGIRAHAGEKRLSCSFKRVEPSRKGSGLPTAAMSSSSPSKKVKADKNQVAPSPNGKADKQYDSSRAKESSSKLSASASKGGLPPPVPKKSTKIGFQIEQPAISDTLEGDWQVDGDKEWSINHCKVLYLISLYAKPALTPDDKESWIRR